MIAIMANAANIFNRKIASLGGPRGEERIDRSARLMASSRGNEARWKKYREEVALLCMRNFAVLGKDMTGAHDEVFDMALYEALDRYDSSKGSFVHYFKFLYSKRRKDAGGRQKAIEEKELSLEAPGADDGISFTDVVEDEFADDGVDVPESEHTAKAESLFFQLLSLVTDFMTRLDDARYAKRKRYVRLFFTETVVRITKVQSDECDCAPLRTHEAGVFKSIELPFLDYFMVGLCRTILQIWGSDVKDGVSGGNRGDPPAQHDPAYFATWTLSNGTYVAYILDSCGEKISSAVVSQQRAHYEHLVAVLRGSSRTGP